MALDSTVLTIAAGAFNVALALFHSMFWRLFRWPESLGALGRVNRQILYILNLALIAQFLLAACLLLLFTDEVAQSTLGLALLWGLSLFWLARALLQPVIFGLAKPLSVVLFVVFLIGAGLHGLAAWSRGAI